MLDAPTASPFTMISVGGNFGESLEALDEGGGNLRSGDDTAVPSGSEGMLVGGEGGEEDSREEKAERGEGSGPAFGGAGGRGVKRRESWRGEGRSGRWEKQRERGGESFEMQGVGMSRRSVSRQSK